MAESSEMPIESNNGRGAGSSTAAEDDAANLDTYECSQSLDLQVVNLPEDSAS
jgi:hypothetical protein